MIPIIQSEFLKYKKTIMRRLILLVPLFFIIIALPQRLLMPDNYLKPWQLLINQIFNWWPVLFIPIGIALFAALVALQERKAGNYRGLRSHDTSPILLWIGKVMVMAIYTFFATVVLMVAVIVSGWITAGGLIPWSKIFVGGFVLWLTSLAIIPIQLWVATWKGTLASLIIGFFGMVGGVVTAVKPYWIYVPWSWPTRLMCPLIGVHPNGTLLEAGNPLLDPGVIMMGIVISLGAFLVFTLFTAGWFSRRKMG